MELGHTRFANDLRYVARADSSSRNDSQPTPSRFDECGEPLSPERCARSGTAAEDPSKAEFGHGFECGLPISHEIKSSVESHGIRMAALDHLLAEVAVDFAALGQGSKDNSVDTRRSQTIEFQKDLAPFGRVKTKVAGSWSQHRKEGTARRLAGGREQARLRSEAILIE